MALSCRTTHEWKWIYGPLLGPWVHLHPSDKLSILLGHGLCLGREWSERHAKSIIHTVFPLAPPLFRPLAGFQCVRIVQVLGAMRRAINAPNATLKDRAPRCEIVRYEADRKKDLVGFQGQVRSVPRCDAACLVLRASYAGDAGASKNCSSFVVVAARCACLLNQLIWGGLD